MVKPIEAMRTVAPTQNVLELISNVRTAHAFLSKVCVVSKHTNLLDAPSSSGTSSKLIMAFLKRVSHFRRWESRLREWRGREGL